MTSPPPYWQRNLRALEGRNETALARALEELGPAPDPGLRGREGEVLPALGGRALVSQYDAVKEAARWAGGAEGTVAVWGGAGVQAAQALFEAGAVLMFWVEPRPVVWQQLLTWQDWTPWIGRDDWLPVFDAREWEARLRNRYHPLWDGAFRTLEWRAAVQGNEAQWDGHRRTAAAVLDGWASDASTQARFAERWYRNTLENLKRLRPVELPGSTGRVVIAGAGPGLDDALSAPGNREWLERRPSGDRLFSTDTAFPALTARGVVPDVVFCLDGQLPSYHHYVSPQPAVPLVSDIASLPLMGRLGLPVVRYLTGHPMGAVIRRHFPELPVLDGSLGNVSGLALQTARALGASSVDAWGADFCYRDGQAYAHGTYVYEVAGRRATRLAPWESRLGAACYGASGLQPVPGLTGGVDTPLLRDYRQRWQSPPPVKPVVLGHGGSDGRWSPFAADWKNRLEKLPLPRSGSLQIFVRTLAPDVREDWLALWPLAFSLRRAGTAAADLPRRTRERALSFLED